MQISVGVTHGVRAHAGNAGWCGGLRHAGPRSTQNHMGLPLWTASGEQGGAGSEQETRSSADIRHVVTPRLSPGCRLLWAAVTFPG